MHRYLITSIICLVGCATAPEPYNPAPSASRLPEQSESWEASAYRYWQTANYQQARSLFEESAKGYRLLDNSQKLSSVLTNLIQLSLVLGDLESAQIYLSELTNLASSLNSPDLTTQAAVLQTNLLIEMEMWDSASSIANRLASATSGEFRDISLLNSAYIELQTAGNPNLYLRQLNQASLPPMLQARLLRLLAEQEQGSNDLSSAEAKLEEAIEIYREQSYPPGVAAALNQMSSLMFDVGNEDEALRLQQRARTIYELIGNQRKASSDR